MCVTEKPEAQGSGQGGPSEAPSSARVVGAPPATGASHPSEIEPQVPKFKWSPGMPFREGFRVFAGISVFENQGISPPAGEVNHLADLVLKVHTPTGIPTFWGPGWIMRLGPSNLGANPRLGVRGSKKTAQSKMKARGFESTYRREDLARKKLMNFLNSALIKLSLIHI